MELKKRGNIICVKLLLKDVLNVSITINPAILDWNFISLERIYPILSNPKLEFLTLNILSITVLDIQEGKY